MKKYILSIYLIAATTMISNVAQAVVIDRFMLINPIQICDDAGANCSSSPLSKAKTQDVYKQAGVASVYLPTIQLNKTSLLNVAEVNDVNRLGNGQSSDNNTLNVWFADSLNASAGFTSYGNAYLGGNGVVINSSAVEASGRTDTVAHEIGHNLGLGHANFGAGGANNVLTSGADRNITASELTQLQIDEIRSSRFIQEVPEVNIELRGSTPFESNDFFNLSFDSGPFGVSLTKFTIDLSPASAFFDPTDTPPGDSGSGLATSGLNGINLGDISFNGLTDGSQFLSIDFTPGAFTKGDSLAFGSDIDLVSAIDSLGVAPSQLVGIKFGFEFDLGLSIVTELDADLLTGTLDVADINDFLGTPVPFGPQVALGPLPPGNGQPVEGSPANLNTVPEPATIWLGLLGFGMLVARSAQRKRA